MNKIITLSLMILLVGCHGEGVLDTPSYSSNLDNSEVTTPVTTPKPLEPQKRIDEAPRNGDKTEPVVKSDNDSKSIPEPDQGIINPVGISATQLPPCGKEIHMDYRALLGAGGAWLIDPAVERMKNKSSEVLSCSIYSSIRNRFKRYLELSKADIEYILEKELPVKPIAPSLNHLKNNSLVPLFVSSFNDACVDVVKLMESNLDHALERKKNEVLAKKIKRLIFENESQVIQCLYTTQTEITNVFRLTELADRFTEIISNNKDTDTGKCEYLKEIKACDERNPEEGCKQTVAIPRVGSSYIATHPVQHSYLQKYVFEAFDYATQSLSCLLGEPNGPVAMMDAGMENFWHVPGHPMYTHFNADDFDGSYVQKNQYSPDNKGRPVCKYKVDGKSADRCVGEPYKMDVRRTAVLLAKLLESPRLSFIGVDGTMVKLLKVEIKKLCGAGNILSGSKGCFNIEKIEGSHDEGSLLTKHHHHHYHVSFD